VYREAMVPVKESRHIGRLAPGARAGSDEITPLTLPIVERMGA
jgi:hypothetical protein